MRLGVRVGEGCAKILDEPMRDVDCRHVEIDEIWGFIGKNAKNVNPIAHVSGSNTRAMPSESMPQIR